MQDNMAKTVRLKVERKPSKKYNIDQQIGLLPREVAVADIIKHLEQCGVTRDDFYRDRRIPYGSAKSISAYRLQIYAQVFDCSIDDLQNHQIKAKSIREAVDNPIVKKSVSKSKLK